ncbi:MAG: L-histidine N(alpha)-methyltransferase [Sphingorhabdus sp.]
MTSEADPQFLADVLCGLRQDPPAIPARWLYDRPGSELFEEITQLPEYYPTRTETALLAAVADEVVKMTGKGRAVVEFGAGSVTKTPLLLRAVDPSSFVPIDISGDFLRASADALQKDFPHLPIYPVEADFMNGMVLPGDIAGSAKLGFFPGSTIGNMVPRSAVDLLRSMRETLKAGAMLLIGFDRVKPQDVLIPAYDDAAGVTAAFNLNLLTRMNRELGGDIAIDAFRHRAKWNDAESRIEMHLEAMRDVGFSIAGEKFALRSGESIHSENSHKYDIRSARTLLSAGGWTSLARWSDPKDWFTLFLAEAKPLRIAP